MGVRLLNWATRNGTEGFPDAEAPAYVGRSKLEVLLGPAIWGEIQGRTVLDFGCGKGEQVVECAQHGAARVIGLDIKEEWLRLAAERIAAAGVDDRCLLATDYHEPVDVILSLDAFEHFADPAGILEQMAALLKPGGKALVSFGPTWYHPLGGHLFSGFPWAHLMFSERTLLKWRSLYKTDGAQTFAETGLNKMTIARFERIVAASSFQVAAFMTVPIRRLGWLQNRLTREFTTAIVRCTLIKN